MDDDVSAFVTDLGKHVLARDWSAAHEMLAPWLRATTSPDDVRAFFENEYAKTLEANDVDELHYPEHPEPYVSGNGFTSATSLREPIDWLGGKRRAVADEVTDENMRYWATMQLQCSDEQIERLDFDFFAEVWMAVVETDEGLRVGYWSQGAYAVD
jgi:hypothetical protein